MEHILFIFALVFLGFFIGIIINFYISLPQPKNPLDIKGLLKRQQEEEKQKDKEKDSE